ncbi:MAG: amidohydrolase family protein [Gammaproteobacteria bacterium]
MRVELRALEGHPVIRSFALAWSVCVSLAPAFGGAADRSVEQPPVALHAGMLLAVPGDEPRPRQVILIDGGIIRAVRTEPADFSDIMPDADNLRHIDLSGYFVMPGLIDAHVHLAHAPGAEYLAHGVTESGAAMALIAAQHARITLAAGFTTVVDLGTLGAPGHDRAIYALRDAIRNGRAVGPRIVAAGNPIAATGQSRTAGFRPEIGAVMDRNSLCDGPADCSRAVRDQVHRGADVISFFNTGSLLAADPVPQAMTYAEMRAIVETAHQLGRRVIADGHHAEGIATAVRAGADVIDSVHPYDAATFASLGPDTFVQSHIHAVLAAIGDSPDSLNEGLWGWMPQSLLERFYRIKSRPFAVMEAYRAGVRTIVYASDAGVYSWGDNARDLLEFVERGMPAGDALRTATVNAAAMLDMDDELGSIMVGKRADLIALDGNPLEDIEAMLRVRFVMRDGTVFKHAE